MGHFILILDTRAPANPAMLINGGAAVTGSTDVLVVLSTSDYEAGSRDVSMMKLWGDVDSAGNALIQPTEGASAWQTFQEELAVRLSGDAGRKTVFAKLRDDVCNDTVEFCDFIDLDLTSPVVTILTPIDRSRISKVSPCNTAVFQWQANRAFDCYEVRVVPTAGSPHEAGVLVGTANGSVNTSATGSFAADAPITTTIIGADLEAASPGDTDKLIKTFVRDTGGVWSP